MTRLALAGWVFVVGLAWCDVAHAQDAAEALAPPVDTALPADTALPLDTPPTDAMPVDAAPSVDAAPPQELGSPVAPSAEQLDSPVAPSAEQRSAARRLAGLQIDELALQREMDAAGQERLLAVALYVGGVGLAVASASTLVIAALQSACVAEADLGCYDAPEWIIGGLATALVSAVLLSGASFADRRASYLERQSDTHRDDLEERRRTLERQVGLALGPTAIRLTIEF
ncbi:hypothetical protein [Sandaracinus amylolyticus]|uniref:hypothetical protein n=1 Tax=Sandaracinus amylolyticus TaxID=927083 RepID=UPI001F1A4CE7|nr:hypothetical protein [Sandaracinus amylolyticus]